MIERTDLEVYLETKAVVDPVIIMRSHLNDEIERLKGCIVKLSGEHSLLMSEAVELRKVEEAAREALPYINCYILNSVSCKCPGCVAANKLKTAIGGER